MRHIALFVLLTLVMACQEEKDEELAKISKLENELELQPSEDRARELLKGLSAYISNHYEDDQLIAPYLKKGADVSKEYGFIDQTPNFLLPLLRSKDEQIDKTSLKIDLGDIMINLNKQHASNVIYKELMKENPTNNEVNKRVNLIDSIAFNSHDYVKYLFDQILINPDEFGVNKIAALKYVDAAEALALVSPNEPKVPDYLYKAAEVARSMRTMPKAMSIYDWILKDYPNYEKTPTILFIKGFIMEQDFKKADEARALYTEFLERYPDHQMASSAKFLLENLGKSDKEILEEIESKKAN